ncbi:SET domain-containing protein SmydA-8 isoform X2 [Toxorhynchites rutilus septentrionalis]|uniref:SET domain-containing protein SmydA-8 isoform X2 n=1 Tax=Toxorhynchites rutilus septentrionalis TaxID=329112 RepID=UPI00247A0783|nr:SET domain-containing protein SmydA-8 isoform X2 [Toxorhynchites rutilus septentrionalis]
MNLQPSNCGLCGVPAKLKCAGCKLIVYCSPEHQKKHWKLQHKNACSKPYELARCEEVGRFFQANRDIPKDTPIFTETPLIIGPKWNLAEYEQRSSIVPCVGCFADCQLGLHRCLACNWPACKPDCPGLENANLHALECGILSMGGGPKPKDNPDAIFDYYRYDALIVLKCLALQIRNKAAFDQMMELESHYSARKGTQYYKEADERTVQYLLRNFLQPLKRLEEKQGKVVLPVCDAKVLHMISGILEVNAMVIPLSNGREICGLYPLGCMLEHCCMPNCFYTFDCSKGMKLTFKAGKDIKKGDHLSTTYTHSLWGTQQRREHLKTNKYFACTCVRCTDPTELGTYLSALKCVGVDENYCNGYQLPIDPLKETSDWKCNQCPVQVQADQVNFLLSKIGEEVDDVMERKSSVREMEELIRKLFTFLHPNHYFLLSLKHSLIQMYGHLEGFRTNQLSDKILAEKVETCREMMKIIDILDPESFRLSLYAGVIFFEQQSALVEITERKLRAGATKGDADVRKNYNEALHCLMRAKKVLANEMGTQQGKKLLEEIVKATERVEMMMSF